MRARGAAAPSYATRGSRPRRRAVHLLRSMRGLSKPPGTEASRFKLGTGAACAGVARERDHEAVGARFGAPYLAVAAEQLTDVRSLLRQPEALEALAGRSKRTSELAPK